MFSSITTPEKTFMTITNNYFALDDVKLSKRSSSSSSFSLILAKF